MQSHSTTVKVGEERGAAHNIAGKPCSLVKEGLLKLQKKTQNSTENGTLGRCGGQICNMWSLRQKDF